LESEDETVRGHFQQLYQALFLLYLRQLTNADPNGGRSAQKVLDEKAHANLIYSQRILTLDAFVKLSFVYGRSNGPLLSRLFTQLFQRQPDYKKDLNNFINTSVEVLKCFSQATSLIKYNGKPFFKT
jgi:hypothetical protein